MKSSNRKLKRYCNGVRYFDQEWLRKAQKIVKRKRGDPELLEGGER